MPFRNRHENPLPAPGASETQQGMREILGDRDKILTQMVREAGSFFPEHAPYHNVLAQKSADIQGEMTNNLAEQLRKERWMTSIGRGYITAQILLDIVNDSNDIEVRYKRLGIRRETKQRRLEKKKQQLKAAAQRVIDAAIKEEESYVLVQEHLGLDRDISLKRGLFNGVRRNLPGLLIGGSLAVPIPGTTPLIMIPANKLKKITEREKMLQWNGQALEEVTLRPTDKSFRQAYEEFRMLAPDVRLVGPKWKKLQDEVMRVERNTDKFYKRSWYFGKIKGFFAENAAGAMRVHLLTQQTPNVFAAHTQSPAYYRVFRDRIKEGRQK